MNGIVKTLSAGLVVGLLTGGCAEHAAQRSPTVAQRAALPDDAAPPARVQRAQADDEQAGNDPYEDINRAIFDFNMALDHYFMRPVAWTYREVVPAFVRDRIHDALNNLRTPVNLLNDLLQGEWDRADITVRRFFINTTIGLGGLIDIADSIKIPYHGEDFGQTLGVWGVGEGFYLVIPFFGPSNPRDALGLLMDTLTDPFTYLTFTRNQEYGYMRFGLTALDERSRRIDETDGIERDSVDLYATYRSLYRQFREGEIRNGETPKDMTYPG
ncbi:MAG: VacJ family lipoprotein, partial [Alphaproteobacteria bacterium]|nr:VacJ family lipoprotein [Alphaproteobacteria bacterium]